jgi:hypothetical protein
VRFLRIGIGVLRDSLMNERNNFADMQFDVSSDECDVVHERRTAKRYPCGPTALITVHRPGHVANFPAWACDLSETGIGLNMLDSLEAGSAVVLLLGAQHLTAPLELPARVVHVSLDEDGIWRVGCEFDRRLDAETVQGLL